MTRGLTFLFAVAGGAAVANLYWAQPLLDFIARDLHASASSAGWLVTATQLGYAAGILLVVPLGDVVNRRRLIPAMMACAAAALVGCALAPSFGLLLIAITVLGLTTVAGQLLTPLAGDLADDGQRGRVVGIVVSGILTGILVSRTLSGLIADAAGSRGNRVRCVHDVLDGADVPAQRPAVRVPGIGHRPVRAGRAGGRARRPALRAAARPGLVAPGHRRGVGACPRRLRRGRGRSELPRARGLGGGTPGTARGRQRLT
jgi:MFS family permease